MNRRDSIIPLCRRTKTDGRLCGSPAVTGTAFCYFHGNRRRDRTRAASLHPRYRSPLRDADSIQRTLSTVIAGIASGDLRPSQAGRMLYALQMAIGNRGNIAPE